MVTEAGEEALNGRVMVWALRGVVRALTLPPAAEFHDTEVGA